MDLEISELSRRLIETARTSLGRDWRAARRLARPELARLAQVLVEIGEMAARGEITKEEAQSLLRIHRNTTVTVLLTVRGLGILAVESAVNEGLSVVRDAVNGRFGITLL